MKWYKVLDNNKLNFPFIIKGRAGRKSLCLVGVDGEVHALAAKCPHAGADITQGICVKGRLVCPYHRYTYDITTGRGAPGQGDYIETYPVEMREDGAYVGVKSWWEWFS